MCNDHSNQNIGVKVPEMRDEIFIQLCKQTTQNPSKYSLPANSFCHLFCMPLINIIKHNRTSNQLGWELMGIISGEIL